MIKAYWRDIRWGVFAVWCGIQTWDAGYSYSTKAWNWAAFDTVTALVWLYFAQKAWDTTNPEKEEEPE